MILRPFAVPLGRCTNRRKRQRVEKVLATGATGLKKLRRIAKDLSVYFMLLVGDPGFPLKEKVMTFLTCIHKTPQSSSSSLEVFF